MDISFLRVRHSRHGHGPQVLTVVGEVDLLTVPLLRLALREANAPHTVVDLTYVEFLDLAGARALAGAAQRAREAGRRFSVVAPDRIVRRVLAASGLADRMEIHCTLAEVFPPPFSGHTRGVLAPTTEEETPWRTHRPSRTQRL